MTASVNSSDKPMSDLEAKRAARRAAMPITTAILAEYAEFSPTVIYAQENGMTYGKPPTDENAFVIPPLYRLNTQQEKKK